MVSPKGQIISVLADMIIISPYLLFNVYSENLLTQFFNNNFFMVSIVAIFVGIILEIVVTDKTFTQYDEKIKIEEKVEADYTKIKTSVE